MASQRANSVEERQRALAERFSDWTPRALHEVLDDAARDFPDRPVVITDEEEISYCEIAAQSRRLAAGLLELGIKEGDKVALVLANYPEYVALKYAISRGGSGRGSGQHPAKGR